MFRNSTNDGEEFGLIDYEKLIETLKRTSRSSYKVLLEESRKYLRMKINVSVVVWMKMALPLHNPTFEHLVIRKWHILKRFRRCGLVCH